MTTVLHELFGYQAPALYGAAIRLAHQYCIDLDDVVQEVAVAALQVRADFGFVHINTAVHHARDALTKTPCYGVNAYYHHKGVSILSYDCGASAGGDPWVLAFADEGFDWDAVDRALDVWGRLRSLTETDRAIALGLAEGRSLTEIGHEVGLHYTTVIKRRDRHLAPIFARIE